MITDNNKVDTLEEITLALKKRLIKARAVLTQILTGLGFMIPDALKQAMPYADQLKDFNKYFYFILIFTNICVMAYLGYAHNSVTKAEVQIKDSKEEDNASISH